MSEFFDQYPLLVELLIFLALIVVSAVAYLILKQYVLNLLHLFVRQTKQSWDQTLLENGVLNGLPHLVPAIILYQGASFVPSVEEVIQRMVSIWVVIIALSFIDKLLSALLILYRGMPSASRRPLKGYVQIVKIFLYLGGGIIVISMLLDQSPWLLLSGLGALTAVLILVFQSTILSFIASLQLVSNDMIRVGDWIEMPKYNADGDIIEVALHSIKVRNFDNTITTIPTYKLIDDSFINWRGMQESGGRRIKRSILIDQTTIKFCDEEMIARFKKVHLLRDYVQQKQDELARYNEEHDIDESCPVNGRRMTNIGTFRAYLVAYLRSHPCVHKELMLIVRQLHPTKEGLPLELYVFTNDIKWVNYEAIQSDIFDHVLAVVSEFDLRVFQEPSGRDLRLAMERFVGANQA